MMESVYHRFFNPVQVSLKGLPNSRYAILRINGEMVAFLAGFISQDGKTFVIPRLAIDIEYGVYSPGKVLIIESIGKLLEYSDIESFDLSHGEEDYKYRMGGVTHFNRSYSLIQEK